MPLQLKKRMRQALWCPVLVVSLLALVACGGGGGGSSTSPDDFVTIVPVANPGLDQHVETGDTVLLDGGGSTNPGGGVLTYRWDMNLRPANSSAVLLTPDEVTSSFTADADGIYEVYLTVFDAVTGLASDPVKTVIISVDSRYAPLFSIIDDGTILYKSTDGVYYLAGSQFYAEITNNSQETFKITRAELHSGASVIAFTENQDLLGGNQFLPGENFIGVFVLNTDTKNDGFEFRYYLEKTGTSEKFIIRFIYRN
jgi:hypothetical protein